MLVLGSPPNRLGTAAEQLGRGRQLGVHLEPDDHLPAVERRGRRPARSWRSSPRCTAAARQQHGPRRATGPAPARRRAGRRRRRRTAPTWPGGPRGWTGSCTRRSGTWPAGRRSWRRARTRSSARSARAAGRSLLVGGGEVADDQRADLLGLAVVGVVVAGRQGVGAEHDAPLDLGTEAGRAGGVVISPVVAPSTRRP